MRDRLRAVECPTEIVDQIGGWVVASVGQGYGQGYPLEVTYKFPPEVFHVPLRPAHVEGPERRLGGKVLDTVHAF